MHSKIRYKPHKENIKMIDFKNIDPTFTGWTILFWRLIWTLDSEKKGRNKFW